jgi:aerobic carbon-monoxide dehydrogenase medium subunit
VKPPAFKYHDPTTTADVIDLLATKENVKLLAGGQSLMAMLNMRFVQPDHIVDLNKVAELAYLRGDGGQIRIGAMTRQRDLEFSALIQEKVPLMHEALLNVGHRQTRNRGTLGGSLCHLDPAAELPAVMTAYDGVIEVRGKAGVRSVPMEEFPANFMTPAIAPDEMVTGVSLTPWPQGHGSAFVEFSRRRGDFALVSAAVLLEFDGDIVRRASITVGGLSFAPTRVAEAENRLLQKSANEDNFHPAAEACGEVKANGDIYGSAAYRQQLARVLVFRALTIARGRAAVAQAGRSQ